MDRNDLRQWNHWFTILPLLFAILVLKCGVVLLLRRPARLSLASSLQVRTKRIYIECRDKRYIVQYEIVQCIIM